MTVRTGRIWVDALGNSRLQTVYTSAGDVGLASAAQAVSNGDWLYYWASAPTVQAPAPTAAVYETVQDSALLTFTTAAGNLVTYAVFAPQSGLFLADGETVNPAAATGVIAAAIAALLDAAGNPVTAFVSGVRQKRR